MKRKYIVELIRFNLIEGIDDVSFLKASAKVQYTFLKKQQGFIQRQLLKTEKNEWVDIVHWTTEEEARKATNKFATHTSNYPYILMIAPRSVEKLYLQPTASYTLTS